MLGVDVDDDRWAEARAANDALEALARAKQLAQRRLLGHQRDQRGGAATSRHIVAIGGGALYIGDTLIDGRTPHGNGTLLLPDGSQHVGAFEGGRAHGPGAWQFCDVCRSAAAVGAWVSNKRAGQFATIDADGSTFTEYVEEYAPGGRRLNREVRCGGQATRAARCAQCDCQFIEALNHAYGCRRHRAEYADAAAFGQSAHHRQLTPHELSCSPAGAGEGKHFNLVDSSQGIWPCCGQHERGNRGCLFDMHRAAGPGGAKPPPVGLGARRSSSAGRRRYYNIQKSQTPA
ncbi:hypothetical protein T492DRAFT_981391 [Pavlovales sp. CCMP2436]|nr:hypothetical protein T492DRAFT_981391 [Pavlovales sp. CCMP2436]